MSGLEAKKLLQTHCTVCSAVLNVRGLLLLFFKILWDDSSCSISPYSSRQIVLNIELHVSFTFLVRLKFTSNQSNVLETQFDQSTCSLLVMRSSCIIWGGCRILRASSITRAVASRPGGGATEGHAVPLFCACFAETHFSSLMTTMNCEEMLLFKWPKMHIEF